MPRKNLSKKIRFEVFKRDKFTCQYCGRKAPEVVLHVDHINPVAAGGENDILNLITSCFECNNGKRDNKLSDTSVVEKQRKQMEELEERREQVEMLFEWRESLKGLEDEKVSKVVNYINGKLDGYSLNAVGEKSIKKLIDKFDLNQILDAVDISAKQYLKYDNSYNLMPESVETFVGKIGGILVNRNKKPLDQKLDVVKNKCKSRFTYWNDQQGAIILKQYVKALRDYGYSDEQIIRDIEKEVVELSEEAKNWSEWRATIENWTIDIQNWDKESDNENVSENKNENVIIQDQDIEFLERLSKSTYDIQMDMIDALIYIGKAYNEFNEEVFIKDLTCKIDTFLNQLKINYNCKDMSDKSINIQRFIGDSKLMSYFAYNNMVQFHLWDAVRLLLCNIFEEINFPSTYDFSKNDFEVICTTYNSMRETS